MSSSFGTFFLLCFSSAQRSCPYIGHSRRKCWMFSFGCPHAGHLGLSTLLKRSRYPFSGKCPVLSWNIRLASALDSLSSLVSSRNFFEGREGSMVLIFGARSEALHSFFHRVLRAAFLCCLSADLFAFSFLRSMGGSVLASDDSPSAAFFASPSTSSLPVIPECPAVHRNVREWFGEFLLFLF